MMQYIDAEHLYRRGILAVTIGVIALASLLAMVVVSSV